MFKAVQNLKRKEFENPVVHDKEGKCITSPQNLYERIREYFKEQFQKDNITPVKRFDTPPRPLRRCITANEVKKATQSMMKNKASGTDNLLIEQLKYAGNNIYLKIADILNSIFEQNLEIDIGRAILVPLQKPPPKKKGPVKNLRPVNLLLVIRKILSKIATNAMYSRSMRFKLTKERFAPLAQKKSLFLPKGMAPFTYTVKL